MRRLALALALSLSLPLVLPACVAPAPAPLVGKPTVETRLFFGTRIGLDREVSPEAWTVFLDRVITPRFPDGLSVYEVLGQYRMQGSGQLVKERTHMVLLLHGGAPESNRAIDEIVREYKARFQQESVMRVDAAADVTF
jgi:hypothetical protein